MSLTTFEGDVYVAGLLVANRQALPPSSVSNASVQAAAGIEATKLQHQHQVTYAQPAGMDAEPETRVVHVVKGATGTVVSFKAGAVTPAGSATTCSVDLKKNGVSILSAAVELTNAQAAYELVSGSVSSASLAAGDVLSVTVSGTGTNEPRGVFAALVIREDA